MSLTEAFVAYSLETTYSDLPEPVRRAASRCLLDHLGCSTGGTQTDLGRMVIDLVKNEGGTPESTLIGCRGPKVPAAAAALANGTTANALDFDDTLQGHPGASVLAAAIATAEMLASSGRQLLTAAVVGYDVCCRLGWFWHPAGGRYTRVWDTATLQTFGSTLAAGSLLGLGSEQMHNAMGIASATAPIPRVRERPVEGEAVRPILKSAWGWAAQAGLRAALLARQGMSGQRRALDGELLLWEQKRPPHLSLTDPADRLGDFFSIEQVEFKPYPACRFLHPALDALSELMAADEIDWRMVERIQVAGVGLLGDSHHFIPAPASQSEAQFSTPFCLAALLYHGALTPEAFSVSGLHHPEVLRLAQRIEVTIEPAFEEKFPAHNGARVKLTTSTGEQPEAVCEQARGTVPRPLNDEELKAKFANLTGSMLSEQQAGQVAERILNAEQESNMAKLIESLG